MMIIHFFLYFQLFYFQYVITAIWILIINLQIYNYFFTKKNFLINFLLVTISHSPYLSIETTQPNYSYFCSLYDEQS